jgi:hypothetical protein
MPSTVSGTVARNSRRYSFDPPTDPHATVSKRLNPATSVCQE